MADFSMTKTKTSLVYNVRGSSRSEVARELPSIALESVAPNFKVLVEGDSWANILWPLSAVLGYNQAFPDIISADSRFLVRNFGFPGDEFEDIVTSLVNKSGIYQPLQAGTFDFLILSGGGNDFFGGDGLKNFLKPFDGSSTDPWDLIDRVKIDRIFAQVRSGYEYFIKCTRLWSPRTHVFLHGYDHAIPRVGGRWLGDPFAALGYNPDSDLCANIVEALVDAFYDLLESIANANRQVHRVDVRGCCKGHWHDELHPDRFAATAVAGKFMDAMIATRHAMTEAVAGAGREGVPLTAGAALEAAGSQDGSRISALVALGSDSTKIGEIHRIAAGYMHGTGFTFPKNSCGATLSAFLQEAGIPIRTTLGAQALADRLERERGWQRIRVGAQRPGDIAVAESRTPPPGADHIFLVVQALDSDKMTIADNQDPNPHTRFASGRGKTPTEYFLRAPGVSLEAIAPEVFDYSPYPFEDEDTNGLGDPQEGLEMPLAASANPADQLAEQIAQRVAEILAKRPAGKKN